MKRLLILAVVLAALAAGGVSLWANGAAEKKPIVWVWLPNDSPPESGQFRAAMDKIVSDATGRPVQDKLTTDYAIAIAALDSGDAQLAWFGPFE